MVNKNGKVKNASNMMNNKAHNWYFPLLLAHIINIIVNASTIARYNVESCDTKQLAKRKKLHIPVIKLKCRPPSGTS